ncbi:MAG: type II secretion system protein, partial [Phycisphaerales bacterium]
MKNFVKRTHRGGFTILELLVTIGILVLVAAGVASIFSSVGETVARGRKLSELNQFAARLERVMREDFENMTRDGFMVIVNKNANYGNDVQLYRGEKTDIDNALYGAFSSGPGRVRRSDEIMFFRRGEFETARRSLASGMIATAQEAAIYYGHGQKRRPDLTNVNGRNNFFFNPQPWDSNYDYTNNTNQAGVGVTANDGRSLNPNEFARDWSLLRQVTLLSTPLGNSRDVPAQAYGFLRSVPLQRQWLTDSDRQIAMQPAGRSMFNSLGWTDPANVSPGVGTNKLRWIGDTANNQLNLRELPSYRASGLVDIVTDDLASIRNMIQSLPVKVGPGDYAAFNAGGGFGVNRGADGVFQNDDQFAFDYLSTASDLPDDATNLIPDPRDADELNLASSAAHRTRIRQWMIDALPSRWNTFVNPPEPLAGVRYEDVPTRLMYPDSQFPNTNIGDLQRALAESNQEMLGSSVFVPRCTEFIVEWSYGFVDQRLAAGDPNYKKMIWYGLDRRVDSNHDGILDANDQLAAMPYRQRTAAVAGTDPVTNVKRDRGMDPRIVVGRMAMAPNAGFNPNFVEIAT